MLNLELMVLYSETCAKYGVDSEQVKLLRESHKEDMEFTKFAYGYDLVSKASKGTGINWVPRYDTPCGQQPTQDRDMYFHHVDRFLESTRLGQIIMAVSFLVFLMGSYYSNTNVMISTVFTFLIGMTFFFYGVTPLHVGDVLYLRKKAEKEHGIY